MHAYTQNIIKEVNGEILLYNMEMLTSCSYMYSVTYANYNLYIIHLFLLISNCAKLFLPNHCVHVILQNNKQTVIKQMHSNFLVPLINNIFQ